MKAYRASIFYFAGPAQAVLETDGLLVVGPDAAGRQVVQAMIQHLPQLLEFAPHPAQIHHHPGLGIGRAAQEDFGVVGVAMHAPAAVRVDLALERVRRIEEKLLTDGVVHRIPVILWVCRLSRQAGRCMHRAMQAWVLSLRWGLSMGCR